jgi:hypothetical protein
MNQENHNPEPRSSGFLDSPKPASLGVRVEQCQFALLLERALAILQASQQEARLAREAAACGVD